MIRYIPLVFLFSLKLAASIDNTVCLYIDAVDTENPWYPNKARLVGNHEVSFDVFDKNEACFDLDEAYYMQFFLFKASNAIAYGTRCYYQPKAEHQGKILRYVGESGSTPCPVVDRSDE